MTEVVTMLVLSTGHIQKTTADRLTEAAANPGTFPVIVYEKGEYGWFIYIPPEGLFPPVSDLPKDLLRVINHARVRDCLWLMLDRDGSVSDALPFWEW